jgi:glucokinase
MIIGVDVGGTNIRAGIVSDGKITSIRQSLLCNKDSLDSTLEQLISTISPLIGKGIMGIGLGVPSAVDVDKGIVYNVTNIPSWKRVELKKILEGAFNLPVFINNDVNCFVLAEHRFGLAKPYSSVVAVALGTGLGAGIIINNGLYCGNNCGAGEVGLLPYLDKDFEFYTSSVFFESIHATTAYEAHENAVLGLQRALGIWAEYGKHLGNLIKAIMYTFDPEAIILGGSIAKAYPFFEKAMKASLADFQFPESVQKLKILCSKMDNIALLGAAALVNPDLPVPGMAV